MDILWPSFAYVFSKWMQQWYLVPLLMCFSGAVFMLNCLSFNIVCICIALLNTFAFQLRNDSRVTIWCWISLLSMCLNYIIEKKGGFTCVFIFSIRLTTNAYQFPLSFISIVPVQTLDWRAFSRWTHTPAPVGQGAVLHFWGKISMLGVVKWI